MAKKTEKKKKRSMMRISLYVLLGLIVIAVGIRVLTPEIPRAAINMESIKVNVKETQEKTTDVALVQSAKQNVADIAEEEVRSLVRKAVKLVGGIDGIVKDGDTVVLKPNFMRITDISGSIFSVIATLRSEREKPHPEEKGISQTANGVTTDYRVTKAVAELVREINPNGKIYVMEASGAGHTSEKMESMGYTHENIPYVDEFISMDDTGKDYAGGETDDLVAVDLGTKRLYEDDEGLAHTKRLYYMDKKYFSADVIIDLPVLKNHQMAAVTGAIKNVAIGSTPPALYGLLNRPASRMAIDHSWDPLNNFIHDYYLVKPVDFVVTDGLQAIEHGPLAMGAESLESVQMNMRLILAGKDALAVDTIHALITGVDPEKVDYLTYLAKDKVGIMDPAKINVVGNVRVDEVRKPFKFPGLPYSFLNPEPRKKVYEDFDAPQVTIQNVKLLDGTLTADLNSNKDLIKLELFVDGKLSEIVRKNGRDIKLMIQNNALDVSKDIEICSYDKYLNCTKTEVVVN